MAEESRDDTGLTARLFDDVLDAVEARDAARLDALLDPMHAADIADLLEQVDRRDRGALLSLWHRGLDGDILSELDPSLREEIIGGMEPDHLAEAVADLETDDVVDLVEDLDHGQRQAVLSSLAAADRIAVEQALAFPEGSAGRLMQSEVVRVPEHWSVAETTAFLRDAARLPDLFYHVILVDPRMRPTGYVTLGRLLSARPDTALRAITEDSFRTFAATDDRARVAYDFNHYHLISAPVVDAAGRLVGVITIDDAMIVLDEEHEEDILRLAGVGDGALSDSVRDTARQRLPWLAINLCTALLAATVIGQFEEAIAGLVALAVLMPIVASMGGNAGTQSLTVAVRALATRELSAANAWRVIRRELAVGALNGVVFAVVMGLVGWLWFGSPALGGVIAVAMVVNLIVAGLAGTVIPVALNRAGFDPALSSGTFVTTVTDVVGFFVFLGLASLVLV